MKEIKQKRKNFKGMTLVEIIVSLAVLSAMTLVLVQTSTVINKYLRSATSVNRKTVDQSPVAEADLTMASNVEKIEDDVWVVVGISEHNNSLLSTINDGKSVGINVVHQKDKDTGEKSVTVNVEKVENEEGKEVPKLGLKGKAYRVNQIDEDNTYSELGGDLHMQFIELDSININSEWKETSSGTSSEEKTEESEENEENEEE